MKILYLTTVSNTMNAFLIPHIRMLIEKGHEVDVAFNIDRPISPEILELGCKVHKLPFQRSPLKRDNIVAYILLKKIIRDGQYDLVHTHTPVASAITRLVCRSVSNVKVFYTAHGFHFYKGASLKNWMIYYPIEKWLSKYTDTLITINKEDYERAKKNFKSRRIEYIPGVGLDVQKFKNIRVDRKTKREEIGVPEDSFLVLSVGELNRNKNHEVIIKAIAKINSPKIHYVVCGKGPLESHLKKLSVKLGITNKVHLLGFRTDIAEICKASDIFAFPSFREGLGMAALESMACGLPLVTSNIHGIVDYSINGKSGYVCRPNDVDGFAEKIKFLLYDSNIKKMGSNNILSVKQFDITNSVNAMKDIYDNFNKSYIHMTC